MWFNFDNNGNFPFGSQNQNQGQDQRQQQVSNVFANLFGFPQQQTQQTQQTQQNRQQPRQRQNSQQRQGQRPRQEPQQQRPAQQRRPEPQPEERPTYTNSKRRSKKQQEPQKASKNKTTPQVLNQSHAMFWKDKGNLLYKQGKILEAIEMYTKGIKINDGHSILYSNRARCYKQLGKLDEALKDIQTAIDLDDQNIKAYLIQGQLLAELGKNEQKNDKVELAIVKMTKALRLCTTLNKPQFKDDTNIYILRAKKLLWLKKYYQFQTSKKAAIDHYKQTLHLIPNLPSEQYNKLLEEFSRVMVPAKTFQIPQHLFCKITYELMQDPVTTQAGHTYERSAIESHLKQNGNFDPFTRAPINDQLYPNLLVKTLIDDFLEQNPWAYEYVQGQNYNSIKF